MTATGIVLAGGRSSRFGDASRSKLAAEIEGRTVLDLTIDAVLAVCEHVVVVGPPRVGSAAEPRVSFVVEDIAFGGPVAGLRAGLESAGGPEVLVVGGDMPLLLPDVLGLLLGLLRVTPGTEAVTLGRGDRFEPLPCALDAAPARQALAAMAASGDRSMKGLLRSLQLASVPEAAWRALDPEADTLLDIDTPADLERARARFFDRAKRTAR